VLITTAATGEGVPELLAALERHRTTDQDAAGTARARLARAEAQVWAILGERLRGSLVAPERRAATERLLEEVADHRLDPYTAADRLLAELLAGR
jgi:LAO/AO transport system kinase